MDGLKNIIIKEQRKYLDCTQLFAFSHKTVLSAAVPIISIVSILGNLQSLWDNGHLWSGDCQTVGQIYEARN